MYVVAVGIFSNYTAPAFVEQKFIIELMFTDTVKISIMSVDSVSPKIMITVRFWCRWSACGTVADGSTLET